MKSRLSSRLEALPLTAEDGKIWSLRTVRYDGLPQFEWFVPAKECDQRDADNMLNWVCWRKRGTYGAALLIREILEATHE